MSYAGQALNAPGAQERIDALVGAACTPPIAGEPNERELIFARLAAEGIDAQAYHDLAALFEILRSRPLWQVALWLLQAHARLAGATPADALAHDPSAVLDAARSSFEPGDTDW